MVRTPPEVCADVWSIIHSIAMRYLFTKVCLLQVIYSLKVAC